MPKKLFKDMTPEEQIEYVETLEKNEKEQNKYITKLETGSKKDDPEMKSYFQKLRMKDLKEEAEGELIAMYGEKIYNSIAPAYDKWIKENAKPEHIKLTSFFVGAFQMNLGIAMGNKEHGIHKVLNVEPEVGDPDLTPEQQKELEQRGNRTPAPLNEDDPSSLTPGGDHPSLISHRNTDEAMDQLEVMLANPDTNSYET